MAGDRLEHEQQQNGAERGHEDAADRELVDAGAVDRAHQEAADERTEYPHHHRVEQPLRSSLTIHRARPPANNPTKIQPMMLTDLNGTLGRVNRLADETSPYLRQHRDNPVDWYPWGDEAFAAARERTCRSCSRSATRRATGAT